MISCVIYTSWRMKFTIKAVESEGNVLPKTPVLN